jgi:hypothetical protein
VSNARLNRKDHLPSRRGRCPVGLHPWPTITLLLGAIQRGELDNAGALLAQVYAELRQLARARSTKMKTPADSRRRKWIFQTDSMQNVR